MIYTHSSNNDDNQVINDNNNDNNIHTHLYIYIYIYASHNLNINDLTSQKNAPHWSSWSSSPGSYSSWNAKSYCALRRSVGVFVLTDGLFVGS